MPTLCPKPETHENCTHWANLVCPKPGKSAVRLGLSSSVPADRATPEPQETKARAREPPLRVAALLYGDLLCPLVTVQDNQEIKYYLFPSIKFMSSYISWLGDKQWGCSDFVWPNLEYFSPEAACPCRIEQGKEMLFRKVENRHPKLGNECPRDW